MYRNVRTCSCIKNESKGPYISGQGGIQELRLVSTGTWCGIYVRTYMAFFVLYVRENGDIYHKSVEYFMCTWYIRIQAFWFDIFVFPGKTGQGARQRIHCGCMYIYSNYMCCLHLYVGVFVLKLRDKRDAHQRIDYGQINTRTMYAVFIYM